MKLITINGFWKDNQEYFSNLAVVYEGRPLEVPGEEDDKIMFYFDSWDELKYGSFDFVITSYLIN